MTGDASISTAPPGLLHNMSSRPRTQVQVHVEPIDTRLGSFSLDDLGRQLSRIVQGRTRATQRDRLATFVCRNDVVASLAERLDHAWALLALRGAVLLYPGASGVSTDRVTRCRDPFLVLNVLARARGNLLLPDAPLVLEPRALDRSVLTDDPRLTSPVRPGK
jgi:hypothetical protein